MTDLRRDPIWNVVHEGIKGDVRFALQHERWRAALILVFSGIDSMAFLGAPASQNEVKREDFVAWSERYIRFEGEHQLTGLDLYGARCGFLHTYGAVSRLSREGHCRNVVYGYRQDRQRCAPVIFRPEVDPTMVIVSIEALADAFLRGVDRSLVDLFAEKGRAAVAERRFRGMFHLTPVDDVAKYQG